MRRVLFDGYWLVDGPPSGRNVVRGLIEGWRSAFPDDVIDVAVPGTQTGVSVPPGVRLLTVLPRVSNHGVWVMLQIGATASRYDAVVSQNFTPLTGNGKFIRATFLHDALFRDRPRWFTLSERLYLGLASLTLPRARRVLTSSEAEADRIRRVFPRVGARVAAVGLSVPLDLNQPEGGPVRVAIERPFILAVGRLNVRKNIQRLIRVFTRGGLAEHFDLIIVGAPDGKSEAVTDVAGVRFTGHVTDSELITLYSECEFFVFPSLGEGFGLPLLEAARFGAPSAASDIPPFREINTAAVYFDPHDDKSMAEGLAEMASQHRRSVNGSKRMPTGARSWADVAVATRSAMFD